ncbi:MAG: type 1 glutamine amidotransferase [Rhizobiaceae bacterium]|jgi:GMP synthase-like glutamine amidotransferase|nr:type 1 glutamine amidotransferase [Rhizobiaceae bacterium]
MHILVIDNYADCPLGLVGAALDEAGAALDRRHPYAGEALPADPSGHDGLIILGGPQNALADAEHPYLPHLARLSAAFTQAGKAVLGICLGSQVMARGHGGGNILGRDIEFGWHTVAALDHGRNDPLIGGLGPHAPLFHWHNDTVTLPPGAAHLATSAMTPIQAWRAGRASYGIQFHFEASTEVVEAWSREARLGVDMAVYHPGWHEERAALAATLGRRADAVGLDLARRWVALV